MQVHTLHISAALDGETLRRRGNCPLLYTAIPEVQQQQYHHYCM
jgi:hypothetical protein